MNNLGFLDLLNIMSFALQIQNSENHRLDQLRDETARKLDAVEDDLMQYIARQMQIMNSKLDQILEKLN